MTEANLCTAGVWDINILDFFLPLPDHPWPKIAVGPFLFELSRDIVKVAFVLKKLSVSPAHVVHFSLDMICNKSVVRICDEHEVGLPFCTGSSWDSI